MNTASRISRYLLGLMFTIFGLNGFLNFIHPPPPPEPLAVEFLTVAIASHFAASFYAGQLVAGLLLLANAWVPLALTVLAAEIYNILAFHITMNPGGIGPGIIVSVLWILVFAQYRDRFRGILTR